MRLHRAQARCDSDRGGDHRLVQEKLARYKCPRYVMFAEMPKTSTGKIQKFKLRELAE